MTDQRGRVAVELAARHGVRCAEPVVLRDGSNLLLHLVPAPVVARVATLTAPVRPDIAATMAKDVALAAHLAGNGFPVAAPSAELPAGPHRLWGRIVTFWTYVEHDPDHVWRPEQVGPLLADLHAALRDFPGELPVVPPLDLADILRYLGDDPLLTDDDRTTLTETAHRIETTLDPADAVPLHGDAHPGNLLHTRHGPVWTDFEDAWRGPVGWDLACLARTGRLDGRAAIANYPNAPDDAAWASMLTARRLQGLLWSLVFLRRFPSQKRHSDVLAQLAEWRAT